MDGSAGSSAAMPGVQGCPDEVCVSEVHVPAAVEVHVPAEVAKGGVGTSGANSAAAFDPVVGEISSQVECLEEAHPPYGVEDKLKGLACDIAPSRSVPAPVSLDPS